MPVVHIHMYKGRTKEQKKELVRRISKDFEEVSMSSPSRFIFSSKISIRKIGVPVEL